MLENQSKDKNRLNIDKLLHICLYFSIMSIQLKIAIIINFYTYGRWRCTRLLR